MNCRRCETPMVPGKAIVPTLVAGLSDFPGQTDLQGTTMSYGGPGQLVDVIKCPKCGHSFIPPTEETNDLHHL